ncbi:MAG: hypothetical protein M1834_002097 [Cirrosporium novae-zelandiae]|nr:MAG: hypothetical protein M1834_002097 [Cirrosporium novae-zelandiae]
MSFPTTGTNPSGPLPFNQGIIDHLLPLILPPPPGRALPVSSDGAYIILASHLHNAIQYHQQISSKAWGKACVLHRETHYLAEKCLGAYPKIDGRNVAWADVKRRFREELSYTCSNLKLSQKYMDTFLLFKTLEIRGVMFPVKEREFWAVIQPKLQFVLSSIDEIKEGIINLPPTPDLLPLRWTTWGEFVDWDMCGPVEDRGPELEEEGWEEEEERRQEEKRRQEEEGGQDMDITTPGCIHH